MEVNIFLNDYVQKLIEYIDIIRSDDIEYQIHIPSIDLIDNKYQAVMIINPNILLDIHTLETLINLPMYNIINFELSLIDQPTQIYLSFDISPSTRLIQLLPDVLTYEILLTLDEEDIINTCHSSPYLEHICQSDDFWRMKFIQDFDYSPPNPKENDTVRDVYHASNNLLGFGRNLMGELANVNTNHEIKINNRNFKVKSVACGSHHSLVIDIHDHLCSFGSNYSNELGHTGPTNIPMRVNIHKKVKMISCKSLHSLMIDDDNIVWGWGYNNIGQLGTKIINMQFPEQIMIKEKPIRASYISAGYDNAFIIDLESNVFASGNNVNGISGLEYVDYDYYEFYPVMVNGFQFKVKLIDQGRFHSLAIDIDDNLWITTRTGFSQILIDNEPIKAKLLATNYRNLFIDMNDRPVFYNFLVNQLEYIADETFKVKFVTAGDSSFYLIDLDNNVWIYKPTDTWNLNNYELKPFNQKAKGISSGFRHILIISTY